MAKTSSIKRKRPTKKAILESIEKMKDEGVEWLSPEEAGTVLGYTRSWVCQQIALKRIKAVPDPRRGDKKTYYLIPVLELERFVEFTLFPKHG